jgi:hypothetical protein
LEKLGDWVTARTQFGREVGRKSGAFDPATGTTVKWANRVSATSVDVPDNNYNNVLGVDKDEVKVFKDNHNKLIEYINVGAGISGGFSNAQELQVMKYHEATDGPKGELWKEEVANEHKRMIDSGVFEPAKMSKVPKGVKLTDTTWAMKKKSSGTLRKRVNVRGFKQIDGQHYNGTSISAPVTNAMTIRIALTIMLMQGRIAHVMDVKGAFLYGEFEDGEKIYIKIPLGFEQFYQSNTVLLLKKTLHGFKQAAMAFYRKLLTATKNIGLTRSTADP